MTTQRHYTRVGTNQQETITVNVDDNGKIRMTAENLHEVLTHLGFQPTEPKDHH